MGAENVRVVKKFLDVLEAEKNFDEAGVVVVEGTQDGVALQGAEFYLFLLGQRGAAFIHEIEAGERADAIDAFGIAEEEIVGNFCEGERFDCFAEEFGVIGGGEIVGDDFAEGIGEADVAVIVAWAAVGSDESHKEGGKICESTDFFAQRFHGFFEPLESFEGDLDGFGNSEEKEVAIFLGERFVDAARDDPARMNALAGQSFYNLLTELAETDAAAVEFGISAHDAEEIAVLGIGVHTEKEIGRREIEKAESVGLEDLREIQNAAELHGGGRDANGEEGVAGFGGGQEMADGADTANALHEIRHFVEGAALAEFLEAAELGDMELGAGDFTVIVGVQRDFGVAFDAGDGVDGDGLAHGVISRLRTA
jgi:hypothetical protein